jgi:RHS repeat-associated protein
VQWGDSYSYDGFGNLTSKVVTKGTAPSVYPQVKSNTNQASMIGDNGFDANGNWLGASANQVNTWNVENQLESQGYVDASGNSLSYTYDPWNQRVLQFAQPGFNAYPTTCSVNFYSITGQRLGTYTCNYTGDYYTLPSPSYTQVSINQFFGGRELMPMDRLGSVRYDQYGNVAYYPWGEERTSTANGTDKFATYFRDTNGLDYARARYYNSNFGRFLSPDAGGSATADPADPQSWNRYAYAGGDPVNFNDPTGQYSENPGNPCGPSGYWFGEGCYTGNGGDPSQPQCGADWVSDAEFSGPCTNPCAPTQSNLLPAGAPAYPACYTTGGTTLAPPPPAAQQPLPLECEADLYYRPVDDWRARIVHATHSYWEVEEYDPNSATVIFDDMISGGPNAVVNRRTRRTTTYLNVGVHSPNSGPDQPSTGTWWFGSGLSATNCAGVNSMLFAAGAWPEDTILYGFQHSPNSNTVAYFMGLVGGFNPPPPPGSWGW